MVNFVAPVVGPDIGCIDVNVIVGRTTLCNNILVVMLLTTINSVSMVNEELYMAQMLPGMTGDGHVTVSKLTLWAGVVRRPQKAGITLANFSAGSVQAENVKEH